MVNAIGAWIRETRKARGWSQEALAEKLGYRRNATISAWETGAVVPKADALLRVATVLNASSADLVHLLDLAKLPEEKARADMPASRLSGRRRRRAS